MKTKFEYGQTVYLKTDKEQLPYIVTAIILRDNITYELTSCEFSNVHQEIEISETKNEALCLGLKN